MIGVGLIAASWPPQFPRPVGDCLRRRLDNPDG
jgi:hypothetical protein